MAVAVAEVVMGSRKTEDGKRMGDEIEAIRRQGPFTQQQVADRLGLSLRTYLGYRQGYLRVSPNGLRKWAKALDIPVPDLARRLRIDPITDPGAPALRREMATLLPEADAAELDDIVRRLSALPPSDRRQIIDGLADHVTGREHRLSRD